MNRSKALAACVEEFEETGLHITADRIWIVSGPRKPNCRCASAVLQLVIISYFESHILSPKRQNFVLVRTERTEVFILTK